VGDAPALGALSEHECEEALGSRPPSSVSSSALGDGDVRAEHLDGDVGEGEGAHSSATALVGAR